MDSEYFVSINTVSRELGIPAYTLRYWEKQFPTIVHPTTGAGGRRYYRPDMVERLRTIQDLLYNRGMTIAGVKKLIRNGDFTATDMNIEARPRAVVNSASNMDIIADETCDVENVFMNTRSMTSAHIDSTKLDLAIGLLEQAKDVLQ